MELDFDKYCIVDGSPTTVLPAPQLRSKVANRKSKAKQGNDLLKFKENFTEVSFGRYRSASCREVQSRKSNEDNKELKRSSVYQCSREVRLPKKADVAVERKKIEFSQGSTTSTSLGIIDSLCSSDDDSEIMERNRFSVMSLSEQSTTSICRNRRDLRSRDPKNHSVRPIPGRIIPPYVSADSQLGVNPMLVSESVFSPTNDGNSPQERDPAINLHKSLSAKLTLPHSPAHSESESSKASSANAPFSPVIKMFDPFAKSKSQRSLLRFSHKNDLFDKPHHVDRNSLFQKKENNDSALQFCPAHLHGILTSENRDGMPYFEFSVKSPEDNFVAKTWKVEKNLSWFYTFHSFHPRKKNNASGWGFKDSNRESSMVGQMNVSCYLRTELKDPGVLDDSLVTEFVLYDISKSRKRNFTRENSISSQDSWWGNCEQNEISAKAQCKDQEKNSQDRCQSEISILNPLKLRPDLETAAIVMKIPFAKRESLKLKGGDRKMGEMSPNLFDICQMEKEVNSDSLIQGKMHVVIPTGNHGLPSTKESRGPSPLLDRWRLGGGCECGGWDMACPLNVIGNPNIQISSGHRPVDYQHKAQLFAQGRKDNVPSFTMRVIEDGKYAVDFHAQLSSLQAFSICVAILHTAEASTAVGQEMSKEMLQSDSLRVFAEEEIKSLIDSIAEEDKFKTNKKIEDGLPSFMLNPPFSPIARV